MPSRPSTLRTCARARARARARAAPPRRAARRSYLNLAADAAHNFTDGLLLGAAFLPMAGGAQATWKRGLLAR